MDLYLKLPGHAGSSLRPGYNHWLEIQSLQFERPLLEKDVATFTIYKHPDALTLVLQDLARSRRPLRRVDVHQFEGSQALSRLRFDKVRVSSLTIDGEADLAMECVSFRAERWQVE